MEDFKIAYTSKDGFKKESISNELALEKNDVLVLPKRVGVCGSDLFYMNKIGNNTLYFGHEWVGIVGESKSSSFKPGDIVTSCAALGCGCCDYCKDGKENLCINASTLGSIHDGLLRTKIVLSEKNLLKLDEKDLDTASLYEVAGIGWEAWNQFSKMTDQKENIMIFGAGAVGLMTAICMQKKGYEVKIVDTVSERVKLATSLGLNALTWKQVLVTQTKASGIIDCSGDSGEKIGLQKFLHLIIRPDVNCLIVGLYENIWELDSHMFSKFSPTIRWMKGMSNKSYKNSIDFWKPILPSLKETLIPKYFSIENVKEAFDFSLNKKESLKTVIRINEG